MGWSMDWVHGLGPWTGSLGWSMDQVHRVVHGPRSMFCTRPDKRSYGNMMFDNVLARRGSSFCNRAHLNFQAFPLHDMKGRSEMAVA